MRFAVYHESDPRLGLVEGEVNDVSWARVPTSHSPKRDADESGTLRAHAASDPFAHLVREPRAPGAAVMACASPRTQRDVLSKRFCPIRARRARSHRVGNRRLDRHLPRALSSGGPLLNREVRSHPALCAHLRHTPEDHGWVHAAGIRLRVAPDLVRPPSCRHRRRDEFKRNRYIRKGAERHREPRFTGRLPPRLFGSAPSLTTSTCAISLATDRMQFAQEWYLSVQNAIFGEGEGSHRPSAREKHAALAERDGEGVESDDHKFSDKRHRAASSRFGLLLDKFGVRHSLILALSLEERLAHRDFVFLRA